MGSPLARIFHTFLGALINTAALARCKDALSLGELFEQFVSREEKPLKRLVGRGGPQFSPAPG